MGNVAELIASTGYGEEERAAVGVSGLVGDPLVVVQGRTRTWKSGSKIPSAGFQARGGVYGARFNTS